MPLLPVRRWSASTARSGSLATSAALTSRSLPLATSVTTITARRAARSVFRVFRSSSFMAFLYRHFRKPGGARLSRMTLLHLLHENADFAAAGQPDLPGGLVGDAEFQHLRLPAFDHVERLGDHRAFDAAAGHRAEKIALAIDHQVGADRPRRRAPGLDHGGKRHVATVLAPILGGFEDVVIGRKHELPPSFRGN